MPKAVVLLVVAVVVGVLLLSVATRAAPGRTPPRRSTATTTTPPSTSSIVPGAPTTAPASTTTTAEHTTTTTRPKTRHPGTTTTSSTAPNPATKLLVANGTSTPDAAGYFTSKLQAQGWSTLTPEDTTNPVSASAVYYASGDQSAASSLAASLGLKPAAVQPLTTSVPVTGTTGASVVLVVGPDLASQATSSSSTTA